MTRQGVPESLVDTLVDQNVAFLGPGEQKVLSFLERSDG
jgi:hypothetical protein